MKSPQSKQLAPLFVLVLGGLAMTPTFATTADQQSPSPASQPKVQAPSQASESEMSGTQANAPDQLMPEKILRVCQSADKNHDGYISKSEFNRLKKDAKLDFKTADANHAGRLDMQSCVKALSG